MNLFETSNNKIFGILDLKSKQVLSVKSWNEIILLKQQYNIVYKIYETYFETWKNYMLNALLDIPDNQNFLYFDAGTAFKSMESRVVDKTAKALINKNNIFDFDNGFINERQNFEFVNPIGINNAEMMGCGIAIKIALQYNIKYIFGDSKITIFYWLNPAYFNINCKFNYNKTLYSLILPLAKQYFDNGGHICYINRNINKADLRFRN